ncbi:MAG: hypothetical protein ACT6TH_14585 [Brevundimonas sp.]|uniref:hypothetical protein n=1 Tax=Brevundimonas sp. TaxID=1871086 RepID=UPI004034EBCD
MGRLTVPALIAGVTDSPATAVRPSGRLTHDVVNKRVAVHDGVTQGGIALAKKAETDTLSAATAALASGKANQSAVTALATTVAGKASADALATLAATVEGLSEGQAGGVLSASTWAELAAFDDADFTDGLAAEVPISDTGTHTDPKTSATVKNAGRFRYDVASSGFTRVGDATLTIVETRLEKVEAGVRVFRTSVTDQLLLDAVTAAGVWGVFDFEGIYLRREFYDYGPPFNKWAKLNAYDAAGNLVAYWSRTNIDTATAPGVVLLTNVANGAVQPGYQGVLVALKIDWDKVNDHGWNDLLGGLAGSLSSSGIEASLYRPPSALAALLREFKPVSTLIAGEGGTEASVQSAFDSLLIDDGSVIARSTYPNSDLSTPLTPRRIEVIDGDHDETITAVTVSGISQGLVFPHFSQLVLPPTGILRMASGGDAPVMEINVGGGLKGGKSINLGSGYCGHIDGDTMPRRGSGPAILRYFHTVAIEDHTFEPHGLTGSSAGIGGAISNGLHVLIRRCVFQRGAGTAPHSVWHTVPSTTDAGLLEYEDCWFDPAFVAVQFIKSHAGAVRHVVSFRNCEGGAIQCGIQGGVGGPHAFVRAGAISGFTSVAPELDPA